MIPNFEFLMTDRLLVFRIIFTAFAKHERTCTVGPKEIHFHSQGGSSALKPTTLIIMYANLMPARSANCRFFNAKFSSRATILYVKNNLST